MIAKLRTRSGRRRPACRGAHQWTDMALPPACVHCGRTRLR